MKKMLVVISMLALASLVAVAQKIPAVQNGGARQNTVHSNVAPAACSPCLWYSGDFDVNNPDSEGLWNSISLSYAGEGFEIDGAVWVPMVVGSDGNPAHGHVRVTSVTFNEGATGVSDYTGSTYGLRTLVGNGEAGVVTKSGTCPSSPAPVPTGLTQFSLTEYSFTCAATHPTYFLELRVGNLYWINVQPTFSENFAYLSSVEDNPAPNQQGWSDDFYNSFFTSTFFGYNFAPTWATAPGVCTAGCTEFSVAVAGIYVK